MRPSSSRHSATNQDQCNQVQLLTLLQLTSWPRSVLGQRVRYVVVVAVEAVAAAAALRLLPFWPHFQVLKPTPEMEEGQSSPTLTPQSLRDHRLSMLLMPTDCLPAPLHLPQRPTILLLVIML